MKTYPGSCHCGAIKFEVSTDFSWVVDCNCSICTKKGIILKRVPADQFKLLAGESELNLYQSGTKVAKHWFCKHCGIHAFNNPRIDPTMVTVNVRCLDDYEDIMANAELRQFDGQHWEEAVAALNK